MGLVSCGIALTLEGCLVASDPSTPCGRLETVGNIDHLVNRSASVAGMLVQDSARVKAYVIRRSCDGIDCALQLLELETQDVRIEDLLLMPSGQYVVAVAGGRMCHTHFGDDTQGLAQTEHTSNRWLECSSSAANNLVASLRVGNVAIYRDAGNRPLLHAYRPTDATVQDVVLVGETDADLLVVAVGDRHVVTRRVHDEDDEELHVVLADPDGERDSAIQLGKPRFLARSHAFSRVVVTPDDQYVVATSGTGKHAETLVFDLTHGALIDRIAGAMVSGSDPEGELPGVSAVSPNGMHYAFRTGSGALALRDMEAQTSCLIRPASAGNHVLAGFSADGTLLVESREDNRDLGVYSRILAYDPSSATVTALTSAPARGAGRGFHLAGAPMRPVVDEHTGEPLGIPWALAKQDNTYFAVQPKQKAALLSLSDAALLSRDDPRLWAVDSAYDAAHDVRSIELVRITARLYGTELSFEDDNGPKWFDEHGNLVAPELEIAGSRPVCIATGTPGSWARVCGGFGRPPSELPNGGIKL